ncbi:MAG: SufE family protein [Flavobacteriales bacterium]|nr:SufE family protein [Flavobacteriales bacterium]MBP9078779.1 SufE family protein [Flavobacteriales bacterium]
MSTRTLAQAQQEVVDEFAMLSDWQDRYELLIEQGKDLPLIAPEHKLDNNLVRGCQSRVWLHAEPRTAAPPGAGPVIRFTADSDALITKGIVALLVRVYDGRSPREILEASTEFIDRIGLREHLSPNRANGLSAMIDQMKRYALAFST